MLHEVIIDELNKQIYSENEKAGRKNTPGGKRILLSVKQYQALNMHSFHI